ncbi:isoprenylcysteine carboxylmethyltransferase family protein [Nonomuraea sp. NPDC049695]|uniref:methyltransferase family protein n=1 Tax=Nonomuraea sp. NPDC049695 TaxID=3154734 RepID=UPI00342EB119
MPITNWLAIAGLLLWLGYEIALRRRTDAPSGGDTDRGSTLLLVAAYNLAIVLIIVLGLAGVGSLPVAARWIGVAMTAAGLGLRAWGMSTLGAYYTRTLRVTGDQRVVTAGPYRLIRHPGYAGSLLIWTGFCVGSGNWIVFAAVAALMLAAYGWRISSEERLLIDTFGDEYTAYQRRTARLVPFVY